LKKTSFASPWEFFLIVRQLPRSGIHLIKRGISIRSVGMTIKHQRCTVEMICFSISAFSSESARACVLSQWLTLSGMTGLSLAAIFSKFIVKLIQRYIYNSNASIILPQDIFTKNINTT
jgi:hypothetical protein